MTGSLQVKKDKYYLVLNTYLGNKRKPIWIATGLDTKGNKRRAQMMLRQELEKYELKSGIVPCDTLFSDYIRYWLTVVEPAIDAVTYQGYELLAKRQVLPYFDELQIRLQDVDRAVLQTFLNAKYRSGRLDGKGGLSPASLRLLKNIVFQTLTEAVKSSLLPANPCQYVTLPQQQRYPYKYFNAQQLDALFEAIKDDPLYPLVKITSLYGLRRSELLGLKWDSIDFEVGTLSIRHTVTKVSKIVEKDKTKNASSHRTFPLTDEARGFFRAAKDSEAANRALFGREYKENEYVFKWPDGHPYSPDFVSQKFSSLLAAHNLPHIRFHELRHSCASLLISLGYSLKDVQEWLGHSNIKTTADVYSHLDITRKVGIADTLAKVLVDGGKGC